jgi:hypothetical protein
MPKSQAAHREPGNDALRQGDDSHGCIGIWIKRAVNQVGISLCQIIAGVSLSFDFLRYVRDATFFKAGIHLAV